MFLRASVAMSSPAFSRRLFRRLPCSAVHLGRLMGLVGICLLAMNTGNSSVLTAIQQFERIDKEIRLGAVLCQVQIAKHTISAY